MRNSFLVCLLLAIAAQYATHAAPLDDLITELPDWGRPPTPHFSGYLDASKGCDLEQNGPVCKIHYWLALAPDGPSQKTVLWLNGGPGSSSLLGWLQEVGPLLLNATGGLMENPWAWTEAGVNLMAIEAPMGVGFSYCSRQLDNNNQQPCANTDTSTAEGSRAALVDFFTNKFPELAGGDFYIAGESYAGVYIPTLAKELLTHPDSAGGVVPLKGILVGDPCTDNNAQKDSMDSMWYAHKYGLMDNEVYDRLQSDACADYFRSKMRLDALRQNANATSATVGTHGSKSHRSVGKQRSHYVTAAELNQKLREIEDLEERKQKAQALYESVVLGVTDEKPTMQRRRKLRSHELPANHNHNNDDDDGQCKLAYRKFLMSTSRALSQGWKDLYIDDYSLFAPVTSKEDEQMADYFNRDDVRRALHVTETPMDQPWPMPDAGFDYTKEYNVCNWQPNIKFPNTTMVDVYRDILPLLERVWVYNGDTDPCVSYEGTREAVKQILAKELDGGSYRPWFYKQEAASIGLLEEKAILFGPDLVAQTLEQAQFAGEVTSYEHGLSFVTFHGSGHMVPQFRPQSSLHFLKRFLHSNETEGAELSPLLPSNATLLSMSDEDFVAAMETWTETAKNSVV